MFYTPLREHLKATDRKIAFVIELCVCCLLEKGLYEEGLLRVGCGKAHITETSIENKYQISSSKLCSQSLLIYRCQTTLLSILSSFFQAHIVLFESNSMLYFQLPHTVLPISHPHKHIVTREYIVERASSRFIPPTVSRVFIDDDNYRRLHAVAEGE